MFEELETIRQDSFIFRIRTKAVDAKLNRSSPMLLMITAGKNNDGSRCRAKICANRAQHLKSIDVLQPQAEEYHFRWSAAPVEPCQCIGARTLLADSNRFRLGQSFDDSAGCCVRTVDHQNVGCSTVTSTRWIHRTLAAPAAPQAFQSQRQRFLQLSRAATDA